MYNEKARNFAMKSPRPHSGVRFKSASVSETDSVFIIGGLDITCCNFGC